jgi:hypothetical protein
MEGRRDTTLLSTLPKTPGSGGNTSHDELNHDHGLLELQLSRVVFFPLEGTLQGSAWKPIPPLTDPSEVPDAKELVEAKGFAMTGTEEILLSYRGRFVEDNDAVLTEVKDEPQVGVISSETAIELFGRSARVRDKSPPSSFEVGLVVNGT